MIVHTFSKVRLFHWQSEMCFDVIRVISAAVDYIWTFFRSAPCTVRLARYRVDAIITAGRLRTLREISYFLATRCIRHYFSTGAMPQKHSLGPKLRKAGVAHGRFGWLHREISLKASGYSHLVYQGLGLLCTPYDSRAFFFALFWLFASLPVATASKLTLERCIAACSASNKV